MDMACEREQSLGAAAVVFIVDDDISVRESLAMLIQSAGWRTETFASAREFLARPKAGVPSCLVLDVSPPHLNGLDLQERLGDGQIGMPIIFITGFADVPTTVRAMKAGAAEFFTKPLNDEKVLVAIQHAIDNSRVAMALEKQTLALCERYTSLTFRERQVMDLVVEGHLNKQTGWKLNISEITVKAHRGNVMRKMKAATLADLINKVWMLRAASANQADTTTLTASARSAQHARQLGAIRVSAQGTARFATDGNRLAAGL